jgi:hypothetical protein
MEQVQYYAKGKLVLGVVSLFMGVLGILFFQYLWQDYGVTSLLWTYIRYAYAFSGLACVAFGGVVLYDCFNNKKEVSPVLLARS